MTIEIKDKSTKTVLLAVASKAEEAASGDKVPARRAAHLAIAAALRKLANGRYANRLLDYME